MLDLLHIPGPDVFLPQKLPFPQKTSENPDSRNSRTAWTGLFTLMQSKSAPSPFGGPSIYHIRTFSYFRLFWFSQMNLDITSGPFHCQIAFGTLGEMPYISFNSHLKGGPYQVISPKWKELKWKCSTFCGLSGTTIPTLN